MPQKVSSFQNSRSLQKRRPGPGRGRPSREAREGQGWVKPSISWSVLMLGDWVEVGGQL